MCRQNFQLAVTFCKDAGGEAKSYRDKCDLWRKYCKDNPNLALAATDPQVAQICNSYQRNKYNANKKYKTGQRHEHKLGPRPRELKVEQDKCLNTKFSSHSTHGASARQLTFKIMQIYDERKDA
uniref:Uncharacterized protein n=1 Tax=Romanomermis culicivorax TaxID=13658 RepID=A0A915JK63_ROMCU